MTVTRRLMLAGSGSRFTIPPPFEFALTSSPDGGWHGLFGSNAVQHNGAVYVGWCDGSGNVVVGSFDDETGATLDTFTLHATLEEDWHDSPAVAVLSDGRLIAAYSRHSGAQVYVRVSSSPEDISAWGAEANIDASLGGAGYTYIALFVELSGKVWMFYRTDGAGMPLGTPSTWNYSTSTNDGATWAAQSALFTNGTSTRLSYFAADFDGVSRFDFALTDGTYESDDASVYHFYMTTAGLRYKTDGSSIGAGLPLDESDLTLVYNGAAGGARFPAAVRSNGGLPVITFPAPSTLNSDGSRTGTATTWHYARWSGSAWIVNDVVSDGGTSESWLEGGFAPEHGNPSVAWLSRLEVDRYEVFRYRTWDGGATWTAEQISDSPSDDFLPVAVRNANNIRAVWVRGTATSYLDYSLGIVGGLRY